MSRIPQTIRVALAVLLLMDAARPALAGPVEAHQPPKPPLVRVARVETGTITDTVLVTGTLMPRSEVLVSSEIDGLTVVDILVEEGERVARGQVLARLSRDALDAQMAQNTASLDRAAAAIAQTGSQVAEARANQIQAEAAYYRIRSLQQRGNAPMELLEQRQAVARIAVARLDAAEQALRLAEADRKMVEAQRRELDVRLAQTEVRAPVGGIVNRRSARIGALASITGDPLFRIIGGGVIELEAEVPETVLARLQPGQPAAVQAAGREEPAAAMVRFLAPEVNRATRLGKVRLSLGSGQGLAIGAYARGTVEIARSRGPVVPLSALLYQPDGPVVQVVKGGVIETRPVTVGLKADSRAEIRSGLAVGEEVVAISGIFVREGDRVTPVSATPQNAAER